MTRKLTMLSFVVRGRRFTAFVTHDPADPANLEGFIRHFHLPAGTTITIGG